MAVLGIGHVPAFAFPAYYLFIDISALLTRTARMRERCVNHAD